MIIWLNGCFGSGKTSVSEALLSMIDKAHIYDPEEVGQFIRSNLPDGKQYSDFQNHPLWRKMNYEILLYTAQQSESHLIVPMTLVNGTYYNEIIGKLKESNVDIQMYSLIASEATIHKRLKERGDQEGAWSYDQTSRCVAYLNEEEHSIKIDTEINSVQDIAQWILKDIEEKA